MRTNSVEVRMLQYYVPPTLEEYVGVDGTHESRLCQKFHESNGWYESLPLRSDLKPLYFLQNHEYNQEVELRISSPRTLTSLFF